MSKTRHNRRTRRRMNGGYNIYADAKRISKIKSKSRSRRSVSRSRRTK